jgi:GntR family transcriptional regulator
MLHNKTIDRYSREKLYIQLTRIFLTEITSGGWQLTRRIPSEDELCRRYGVSKITVRQAVNNLVSDGYLTKIQGKGTYLTSILPVVGLAMRTRFTEEMFGKEVTAEKEILLKEFSEPVPVIRTYLSSAGRIYRILSRRNFNGEPAYLDESFIPSRMLPDIEKEDFIAASLYSLLQEKGTMKIFRVIQTLEIANATDDFARNLNVTEEIPLLAVHRLLLSSDDTPVAYTRLLGRSDRYKFQEEFERIR